MKDLLKTIRSFLPQKVLDEENEIRTNISYAYSLGKSGEKKQATKILNSIISKLENSKPRKATHYELLDFEPLRQEALMWGLLAEYSSEPKAKNYVSKLPFECT